MERPITRPAAAPARPEAPRELEDLPAPLDSLPAPAVTYLVEQRYWRLEADYTCRLQGTTIHVPAGFCFDLASVPRLLWIRLAPNELGIASPLIHDWLYRHQGAPPAGSVEPTRTWSRLEADRLFRHTMAMEHVPERRRRWAYLAVRLFGCVAWRRHR